MGAARETQDRTACAAEIPRLGRDAAPEAALALLMEHGVLVIEGALQPDGLVAVCAELEPWFAAAQCGRGPFFGRGTRRFSGIFAKAPSTVHMAIDGRVLPLMEAVLQGDAERPRCDAIELNLTQAIGIQPGEPAQLLHRDEELWPFAHDYEVMTNAMWTLDDFTSENGATLIVPGSHRWSRDRYPQPHEIASATAPRGSVILWLGGVLHGGGANRSAAIRRGLVMSYRLGWLAGGEKLLLSIPPAVARGLPERLQRLIGYQLHRPNLGWVEGRDPLLWLHGDIGALAPADDNLTREQERMLAAAGLAAAQGEAA
jgi:hypothetical protein